MKQRFIPVLSLVLIVCMASCMKQDKTEATAVATTATKNPDNSFVLTQFLDAVTFPYPADTSNSIAKYVRRIYEDSQGNLWIGTNNYGVSRFDGDSLVYFSLHNGLSGRQVTGILEDRKGNIWFSTTSGISRYDGKQFTSFTEKDGLSSNAVWSLYEDSNGVIWAGTVQGLCRYNPEEGGKFTAFSLPEVDVQNPNPRYSTKLVSSIAEDSKGNLWFGTDGAGLYKYDPQAEKAGKDPFTHLSKKDGLCDNSIVCILEDREGRLWFSSRFGGLSRYSPSASSGKRFTNYTVANGAIGNDEVWTMLEDSEGNLWFSSEGFGLYRFKDEQITQFGQNKGFPIRAVQSIFQDSQGMLWAGGGGGLYFFDGKQFTRVSRKGPWPGC